MDIPEIGLIVTERRKSLGVTQSKLAELASININTLYKLERGQTNPTLEILLKIIEILGLELTLTVKRKF